MTESQTKSVRTFFEHQQVTDRYAKLKRKTCELDAAAAERIHQAVCGDVLSIGGVWDFFEWVPEINDLTVLDLSTEMLNAYCPDGARRVEGDLYEIEFPARSFDTVVFPLMLHHTPRGGWRSCTARIDQAFERATRWTRPGGQVLIIEYCPHPVWWPVQRVMLPATRQFLAAFGQPLVVMYTRRFYEGRLRRHFDRVAVERVRPPGFNYWTWYPIFMSVGWLRMPLALYPKLHIFRATLSA